jgi:ketosteroid isomerase-like protein
MEQNTLVTEDIINSFFQCLAAQDANGIADHFAQQIDWLVPGNTALPWVGHRSHRNQVAEYFRTMWSHFVPGKSTANVEKLIISGNDAIMFGTFTHTAASTGRSWNTPVAMHLEVADGKIVKLYLYEDTWAVSKAFYD